MSKFLNPKLAFEAYVPGEQPKDKKYVKLNTNESPFPPSEKVIEIASATARGCNLYCDTECVELLSCASEVFGVDRENILAFNGSDEALSFAFYAYGQNGVCYPSISYGFYPVFANFYNLEATEIQLNNELCVDYRDYLGVNKMVVIANPNAPTGLVLSEKEIEEIVKSNSENVVVIDEAYVEFGATSVIPLTKKYDNLLVTRTFSKSHSLAGARLGFAIGNKKLIDDLNKIRYSFNPYNVNAVTQAMGAQAFRDNDYYIDNCKKVIEARDSTIKELRSIGFTVTDSKANFIFAKTDKMSGKEIFLKLRERGFLIRRFDKPEIKEYLRISVGKKEDMERLVDEIASIITQKPSIIKRFGKKIKSIIRGEK